MKIQSKEIAIQTERVVKEILNNINFKNEQVFVIGCSTSAVQGFELGKKSSLSIAESILSSVLKLVDQYNIYVAVQCCEHLNRAIVVERQVLGKYKLEEVCVTPILGAGGALGEMAMKVFKDPVVVEKISAHVGMDVGGVLIGMHIKHVAVPLKLKNKKIGEANITAAFSRPKLIGGTRAVYDTFLAH